MPPGDVFTSISKTALGLAHIRPALWLTPILLALHYSKPHQKKNGFQVTQNGFTYVPNYFTFPLTTNANTSDYAICSSIFDISSIFDSLGGFYFYLCVAMCTCYVCASAHRGQR